jgi:hypothetical protein
MYIIFLSCAFFRVICNGGRNIIRSVFRNSDTKKELGLRPLLHELSERMRTYVLFSSDCLRLALGM